MSEAAAPPAVSLDVLVEKYVALRDKKAEIESAHKLKIAKYDEAMTKLENIFLRHLNESGSESVRTAMGTFFKSTKSTASVADWEIIKAWVLEDLEARWPLLKKQVSKEFVEAFKDEHNDIPPGINLRSEVAVNVRRA